MPADFNFYINRQGARGRQGVQGEPGFSPVVTVNTDTATEYTLNIETADGVLTTPNLKSTPLNYVAGAGNYVMFDPSTQQIYNSDVPDELVLRTDLATVDDPGIIQIADDEDFDEDADDVAVTPKQLNAIANMIISDIPTDYVNLSSSQTIRGIKIFIPRQEFNGGIRLSNASDIMFNSPELTNATLYLIQGENRTLLIGDGQGNNKTIITNADVDNTTIEVNTAGKLHVIGAAAPDEIDGGIEQPGTKVFTITTNSTDVTISNPSVTVTQSTPGTTTVTYSNASNDSTLNLTINYANSSVIASGTLRHLDPEGSRWITSEVSNSEILNDSTTTWYIFTFDPLTLTIAVNP